MSKTLFLAAFIALAALPAAQAQTISPADVAAMASEMPTDNGADGVAGADQASPTVYLRGAPINMRPGAYRDRVVSDTSQFVAVPMNNAKPAGTLSYPDTPKPTSVQSYNAGLTQGRAARIQQGKSVIPSPFPEGW